MPDPGAGQKRIGGIEMAAMTTYPATGQVAIPAATVRGWLRLEGVAAFATGLALYGWLGGPWLVVLPFLLVPDVSAIGYLRGPRLGAFTYNVVHNWGLGLAVLGIGLATDIAPIAIAGAVLIAHVGMDRAAGYGLKLSTSFQDTHLGRIGRERSRLQS
jgi:hypothetical protein